MKVELFQELEGQIYPVLKFEVEIYTLMIVGGCKLYFTHSELHSFGLCRSTDYRDSHVIFLLESCQASVDGMHGDDDRGCIHVWLPTSPTLALSSSPVASTNGSRSIAIPRTH